MLLRATEIRHRYGDRITLDAVAFALRSGDRVALTGRNGAGKTTLLRIILGQVRPDSGELEVAPDTRIGALEQDPSFLPGLSVTEVLRSSLHHVRSLETRLRELEPNLSDEAVALEWSRTLEAFERAGGYSAESRAMSAVHSLALDDFLEREAVTLSGGERTRLALACALCEEPDVLVLDEPTNHLDIAMREWLETRLREYPGALLIVSHDRALLDAVARETWHLERGGLSVFKGGYSKARTQRLEARRIQAKQSRLGRFEVSRLESAAKRVAQWGKNNDKLARRAKAIEARAERARGQAVEAPIRERKIAMSLEAGKARARVLVKAEHLSKHYGERVILKDAGIRVRCWPRTVRAKRRCYGLSSARLRPIRKRHSSLVMKPNCSSPRFDSRTVCNPRTSIRRTTASARNGRFSSSFLNGSVNLRPELYWGVTVSARRIGRNFPRSFPVVNAPAPESP
jgi:ATPase subunit of ABC transporter with duplicated ATPase domains